jgi:hypothetical protein
VGSMSFGLGILGMIAGAMTVVNVIFNAWVMARHSGYKQFLLVSCYTAYCVYPAYPAYPADPIDPADPADPVYPPNYRIRMRSI